MNRSRRILGFVIAAGAGLVLGISSTTTSAETEPNDTHGAANPLPILDPCSAMEGAISPVGDLDRYSFLAAAGDRAWILVDTGSPPQALGDSRDAAMNLEVAAGPTFLEGDEDDGTGNGGDGTVESGLASVIAGVTLPEDGVYIVSVAHEPDAPSGVIDPYRLYAVLTDATHETPESEGNNTAATANPILSAGREVGVRTGWLDDSFPDSDFYSFSARAGDQVLIAADGDRNRDGFGTNLDFELLAPDGVTVLVRADSSEVDPTPFFWVVLGEGLVFNITADGTYFVRVYLPNTLEFDVNGYDLMVANCTSHAPCVVHADCSDGNDCTDEVCNPDGSCTNPGIAGPCDDGLFCNGADSCSDGSCGLHAGDPCAANEECNDVCGESADTCIAPPDALCGDPAATECTLADICDGAGACLRNDFPDGWPCMGGCACSGGVCSGPVAADLTSGTTGTFINGQSFNETRGVDITVLAAADRIVQSMTLDGLSTGVASASVGARIYNSASATLVASAGTTVPFGTNQSVTIPITATLTSGASYRLAYFVDAGGTGGGSLFDPAPPSSGGFPYTESTGTFRVNQAYSIAADAFPAGSNIFAPRITVESATAEINNGTDDQCAGQPGFALVDEISGVSGFFDPADPDVLSWPAQTGAVAYHVGRAVSPDFAAGCVTFGVVSNAFTDPSDPAPLQVHYYVVRSSSPNTGSWGAGSDGVETTLPCAP